jgi:tRNA threonylcarbamoyladenosine biosynthesis protein TsaE
MRIKAKIYITQSSRQTFNLGKKLAQTLKGGEILALIGPLGAGKTILVKGIAAGLGIKKIINSPTFVLMKSYQIKVKNQKLKVKNLVHLDGYRLKKPKEILEVGIKEYLGQPDTVTVIEWADKMIGLLPAGQTKKIIIRLKGKNQREIIIK